MARPRRDAAKDKQLPPVINTDIDDSTHPEYKKPFILRNDDDKIIFNSDGIEGTNPIAEGQEQMAEGQENAAIDLPGFDKSSK